MSSIYITILQNSTTGKEEVFFVFQKMKYTYDSEEKKRFEPVSFPVNETFKHYMEWKGYQEDSELELAEKKYGKNRSGFSFDKFTLCVRSLALMSRQT